HYVGIGFQVVDPATNRSLPIADLQADPQPGPALTGWTIASEFWQRDKDNETLAIAPVYTIQVTLNVHTWKLFYEVLMGVMVLWELHHPHIHCSPYSDVMGRYSKGYAFQPRSDLEIFLNEAIYYPCFVLAVWCVMAGVISTRSVTVKMLKDFRSWGEAMNPFEGMTRKKQQDLEKNLELTQKEMEAEEALQRRMRSESAPSPVVGPTTSRAESAVRSPEGIDKTEEQDFFAKSATV
ncbi:hypothetical protein FS837_001693, partial [Tulasnella sp. UAMH 9824]